MKPLLQEAQESCEKALTKLITKVQTVLSNKDSMLDAEDFDTMFSSFCSVVAHFQERLKGESENGEITTLDQFVDKQQQLKKIVDLALEIKLNPRPDRFNQQLNELFNLSKQYLKTDGEFYVAFFEFVDSMMCKNDLLTAVQKNALWLSFSEFLKVNGNFIDALRYLLIYRNQVGSTDQLNRTIQFHVLSLTPEYLFNYLKELSDPNKLSTEVYILLASRKTILIDYLTKEPGFKFLEIVDPSTALGRLFSTDPEPGQKSSVLKKVVQQIVNILHKKGREAFQKDDFLLSSQYLDQALTLATEEDRAVILADRAAIKLKNNDYMGCLMDCQEARGNKQFADNLKYSKQCDSTIDDVLQKVSMEYLYTYLTDPASPELSSGIRIRLVDRKEELLTFIKAKSLSISQKRHIFSTALDENSALGKFFRTPQSIFEPNETRGTLGQLTKLFEMLPAVEAGSRDDWGIFNSSTKIRAKAEKAEQLNTKYLESERDGSAFQYDL